MAKEEYRQFNCMLCGFSVTAKTEEELLEHIRARHMGFDWRWGVFPRRYMAKEEYNQFNCMLCGFSVKAKTEEELLEHIRARHMGFDWRWGVFPRRL